MGFAMIRSWIVLVLLALGLTGCERLGMEDPAKAAATREADGKAIGAGCRHAGRGLEDCFDGNPQAQKAAVFAGWREMNDYMTENQIATAPPAPAADSKGTDKPAAEPRDPAKAVQEPPRVEKTEKPRRMSGA